MQLRQLLRRIRAATVLPGTLAAAVALLGGTLAGPAAAQDTTTDPTTGQAAVAASPTTFTHPGVMVSRSQLDYVRTQVQSGAQPWASAYQQMTSSSYASLSRAPKPRSVVECGSYSNPNNGCTDEREDAIAAYTDALIWYVSRDSRYADKAIELMNAWSAVITDHTNSNAPLQTGWAGSVWPRAAEIIRYTYTGWSASDTGRFTAMLRDVYLPEVINGSRSNGNWELSMMEAAVGISIFIEDPVSYDKAITRYLNRVPAYVYLSSDGSLPKTVPGSGLDTPQEIIDYWQGQSTFVTGITQETCRDFTHTGYGISAISHIAETALIQGQDLYPQVGERLRQALGFQTTYENGAAVPSWLCPTPATNGLNRGLGPVTEPGFNAMHNRYGYAMANTQSYTESHRPQGTNNLFVAWETLTNAENPYVTDGTPPPPPPAGPITGTGGKCVDVAGAETADGTPVQLWECNGTGAQQWSVAADGTLRTLGKCMDVTAAGTANGTQIQLYSCNGTGAQRWQPQPDGTLVNPASGKCLDATGQSSANGTRLQIWTCTGTANQLWTLPA
jgi:hypothetical protein